MFYFIFFLKIKLTSLKCIDSCISVLGDNSNVPGSNFKLGASPCESSFSSSPWITFCT